MMPVGSPSKNIGRERYGMVQQEGFHQLHEWLDHFDSFWKEKLNTLKLLLNQKSEKINL